MPSFKINDVEWEALYELPIISREIYYLIRKYMDYATGITGIKRKLNIPAIVDYLACEPKTKRKSVKLQRGKIRNDIAILEKAGLIKHIGPMVFECLMADSDKSNQNKSSQNPATSKATNTATKMHSNSLIKKEKTKTIQPLIQPCSFSQSSRSPVSGIYLSNLATDTSLPDQELQQEDTFEQTRLLESTFDQFWEAWPNKKGKALAQRYWKKKKLAKHIGDILADIAARQKLGYFDDLKFVPYGSTYVSQDRWKDEDKTAQGKQAVTATMLDMSSAEQMYADWEKTGSVNPNSFAAEIISCIGGFRGMPAEQAKATFTKVYAERKDDWIKRKAKFDQKRP